MLIRAEVYKATIPVMVRPAHQKGVKMAYLTCRVQYLDDTDPFTSTNFPEPTRPPTFMFNEYVPLIDQIGEVHKLLRAPHQLDDCTLQLSHNGTYMDLESSLEEQRDELEGFNTVRKPTMILRTQLSVRVHACIGFMRYN
ncbi:FH1/FH2 domain-containing protein 3-like isoform X2 [Saccoglossus kowalevskii]